MHSPTWINIETHSTHYKDNKAKQKLVIIQGDMQMPVIMCVRWHAFLEQKTISLHFFFVDFYISLGYTTY